MANDPLTAVSTRQTPQSEPSRSDQVENSAGGYVFRVSDEERLRRFLILGTEGGSYYTTERELTRQNAEVVMAYAENDPRRLVDLAVEISVGGRAPKQNPAIFALAVAASLAKSDDDRHYAYTKVNEVCRTGTHLFLFIGYTQQFRGWGMGLRKAVRNWYASRSTDAAALQAVKYRQRDGWSNRDLLRLSHPKVKVPSEDATLPQGAEELVLARRAAVRRNNLYGWITQGQTSDELPYIVWDYLDLQKADARTAVQIIERGHGVTWELIPTELLNEKIIWEALLEQGVPMTALMRQLPRLTNIDVFKSRTMINKVVDQFSDQEAVRQSRVHPVNVLLAQYTYAGGASLRGSGTWKPIRQLVDALDGLFYTAFGNVIPADKKTLIGLDVSGSMGSPAPGLPLDCRTVSGAMSLVTMATEPDVEVIGFTGGGWNSWGNPSRSRNRQPVTELAISPRQRLDDVVKTISGLPFGSTDCALPMLWALEQRKEFDTFVIYTDSETWYGRVHPHQALEQYRQKTGIDAKLIVVGIEANPFSIADPKDPGMLDVVGFDSAVPNLISEFSRGLQAK